MIDMHLRAKGTLRLLIEVPMKVHKPPAARNSRIPIGLCPQPNQARRPIASILFLEPFRILAGVVSTDKANGFPLSMAPPFSGYLRHGRKVLAAAPAISVILKHP